jgi:hypothetical protein
MCPLAEVIELQNDRMSVGIAPQLGAGLAWFDICGEQDPQPTFRSWPPQGTRDPVALACFLVGPHFRRRVLV